MEPFQSVALLEDLPEEGLVRGQVGAVVETLDAGHYEVEFVDVSGRTYGLATLARDQIMPLLHDAVRAA